MDASGRAVELEDGTEQHWHAVRVLLWSADIMPGRRYSAEGCLVALAVHLLLPFDIRQQHAIDVYT